MDNEELNQNKPQHEESEFIQPTIENVEETQIENTVELSEFVPDEIPSSNEINTFETQNNSKGNVVEDQNLNTVEQSEITQKEVSTDNQVEKQEPNKKKNNKNKKILICVLVIVLVLALILGAVFLLSKVEKNESKEIKPNVKESDYRLSGNSLEAFDLYFLQLENEEVNKLYSPLSIKYALAMLNEGASGETKDQITAIIGDYQSKKYINSENMSLANVMFIRNTFKDSIKEEYKNVLLNKYNAELILDSFESADNINNWVKDKTLGLLDNLVDDVSGLDFALINALAIDMEWVNLIQPDKGWGWSAIYPNENYSAHVSSLDLGGYTTLTFDTNKSSKATQIGASINNYDIVSDIGEENIRKTVGEAYQKWLDEDPCDTASQSPDLNTYLDDYVKDINTGYGKYSSSTDFLIYIDDDVKVFAKDLKEYNGTTLQYVGIMPINEKLNTFVKNIKVSKLNEIINNLKDIKSSNFKEGVITRITGSIPLFKFEYELNLMSDLKKLGVTDVFNQNKANLSKISTQPVFIKKAIHKSNIEFSNEGIKASAATMMGGAGAAGCEFIYNYDVPVEEIDLTFDKPYMFIIRDKETGEVWFTGTVYEPIEWSQDKLNE